jgi:hypothetical protein
MTNTEEPQNDIKPKLRNVEIRAVVNGFIVSEPLDRQYSAVHSSNVHVFQTFGALVEWLCLNVKMPLDQPMVIEGGIDVDLTPGGITKRRL